VRAAIEAALDPAGPAGRVAWVLSNHDIDRLPDRVGPGNERAAALLALTLPGTVFVYQGDEIGMANGPGGDPPIDRWGRDRHRHPMRWSDDEPHGGFTAGTPWLPAAPVDGGAVATQERDPGSLLRLYRDLVALRRTLEPGLELLDAAEGVVAYRRGEQVVALNLAEGERPAPAAGTVVRHTHGRTGRSPATLARGEGFIASA
jgi:alpha-glucosidase